MDRWGRSEGEGLSLTLDSGGTGGEKGVEEGESRLKRFGRAL